MLNIDRLVKHTGTGKSFAPKVSLSSGGLISISDAATKKYGVDTFDYAILYYDPEASLVVIQLTNEKEPGTMKIRHRITGAYIAAASFIGNFEIKISATTMYDLLRDTESGLLYFDMNNGTARKPPRKTAKSQNEEEAK